MDKDVIIILPTIQRRAIKSAMDPYYAKRDQDTINSGKKPRGGKRREQQRDLVMALCIEVIEAQLKVGKFKLDLSGTKISLALGVSMNQAKNIRLLAYDMGLIFFPEWSRPKAPGHYPIWLLRYDFMNVPWEKKEKRVVKNSKYVERYYEIRSEAYVIVADRLRIGEQRVTTALFMQQSYLVLDELLGERGLTKEGLLRKKPKKKD